VSVKSGPGSSAGASGKRKAGAALDEAHKELASGGGGGGDGGKRPKKGKKGGR